MLRIVPWTTRNEWLETYEDLYSFEDIERQMKGIERVAAWTSRGGSKLPLSVEATASLVEACMQDIRSQSSENIVRQTMAMVIVRFVNGMVDMEQKGAYARSVQSIADEIGLPDWLVDLRHEATHAGLPSLDVLRAGCRFALKWLQDCYWESQIAEFRMRDESLLEVLEKYARLRKDEKKKKQREVAEEVVELVNKYNMWALLLELSFGENGCLVPSVETIQEQFPECANGPTLDLKLPKYFQNSLTPLFKVLQRTNKNFMSNLLLSFVNRACSLEQHAGNKLLTHFYSCWIYFILVNCNEKNGEEKQWSIGAKFDSIALLEVCLYNPFMHTQRLLPLIIENLEMTEGHLKEKFLQFSAINFNQNAKGSQQTDEQITERFSKEFPLVFEQEKRSMESEKTSSPWTKCPKSFASTFKFGSFIGQQPVDNKIQSDNEAIQVEIDPINGLSSEETLAEIEVRDVEENVEGLGSESNKEPSEINSLDTSLVMKEFTPQMIQDISKNIWIF